VNLLLAVALFSQVLNPLMPQSAYTTADPINDDRLGLATVSGRYSVKLGERCESIGVGQNVVIYPYYNIPPWLTIASPEVQDLLDTCQVLVYGRMSNTPCFTNEAGDCDVAAESAE
jgi:hypothetical protein